MSGEMDTAERRAPAEPQRTPLLIKLAVFLWFLPCFAWFGWLCGLGTIEPAEMHDMIEGTVIFFALGLLLVCCHAWQIHLHAKR